MVVLATFRDRSDHVAANPFILPSRSSFLCQIEVHLKGRRRDI
jgi:hypothetical protein